MRLDLWLLMFKKGFRPHSDQIGVMVWTAGVSGNKTTTITTTQRPCREKLKQNELFGETPPVITLQWPVTHHNNS